MLVDQVKPECFQLTEANPCGRFVLANSICKALQFVGAECHTQILAGSNALPAGSSPVFQFGFVLIQSRNPRGVVVDLAIHMSGLRDLFVWKQKATTDAPDTYNA
ncbi:hypothetical protein [Pseudomonas fluorescens]|uniref:hypothetical protein n=1 Tax=Pseudomonas fluorescens TaxID=294 RepID=UPI00123EF683|nr:hypothetical protein [Pseudomonas fluorescens]